jgi:hypothetical protein
MSENTQQRIDVAANTVPVQPPANTGATTAGTIVQNVKTGIQDAGVTGGKILSEKAQDVKQWVKDAGVWGIIGAVLVGMLAWVFGNAFGDGGLLGMVLGGVLAVGLGTAVGPSFGKSIGEWFGGSSPAKDGAGQAQARDHSQGQQQTSAAISYPPLSYPPPPYTPSVPSLNQRGR